MNDTVNRIKSDIQAFADFIPRIVDIPPVEFERQFHERLNGIDELSHTVPAHRKELMRLCFELTATELDKSIVSYHSRNKPIGYAGDFMTIDYIYTHEAHPNGTGRLWDEFYHRQHAPIAIRNRKDFFIDKFTKLHQANHNGMSLLNIASGPCRDIHEALSCMDTNPDTLHIHCVDVDKNAVEYAKDLLNGTSGKANFKWEVGNVFRIRPAGTYDMVWSAGLFDYFDDKYATALTKRMWAWTKPGGKTIIGNFHPRNPSRNYMEWTGEWFLIHRTEDDMLKFIEGAGIPSDCVSFEQEPLGVNIFAVINKP